MNEIDRIIVHRFTGEVAAAYATALFDSDFFPPVALVCAFRLAKPHSPWSRWFYSHEPRQLQRSHERFDERDRRLLELKDRFYDLIGGAPSSEQASRPAPPVDLVDGYLSVRNQDEAPAEPTSVRAGGSPGV